MITTRRVRIGLAAALAIIAAAGTVVAVHVTRQVTRTEVTAYFENSNNLFVGDDVRIRGVRVGSVEKIEPEPTRAKITFWFDSRYKVPADANAVILSPTLVPARVLQLTPPYHGGPTMTGGAVIPTERTAVPVEWDDFRAQLERLTTTLQPTEPGGVSTLGALIETGANNVRGQGANIRDALVKLSQAVTALGDHSGDTFTTVRNLSVLVSALQDSTTLIRQLNLNLASVTGLFANDPHEVADAVKDLNDVMGEVKTFVAENRDTLGTTSEKLSSVSTTLNQSLDDIKQLLHVLPTVASNFQNVYQPAQGTISGALAVNNFANPITFLCGAIQAASRLNNEQSAKLCTQYLAPIVKNRQMNFPPLAINPFVGASARPNEITYSEDRLRPDFVPPQPDPFQPTPADGPGGPATSDLGVPLAAETPLPASPGAQTDPGAGLAGIMVPNGVGS